jgi:hypothetical protein
MAPTTCIDIATATTQSTHKQQRCPHATWESRLDFESSRRADFESGFCVPPCGTQQSRVFASRCCCWASFCNGGICFGPRVPGTPKYPGVPRGRVPPRLPRGTPGVYTGYRQDSVHQSHTGCHAYMPKPTYLSMAPRKRDREVGRSHGRTCGRVHAHGHAHNRGQCRTHDRLHGHAQSTPMAASTGGEAGHPRPD